MPSFFARRNGSDFDLYMDGHKFGRLADCEITHVFCSEDEELQGLVNEVMEGDYSIREMLAVVRRVATALNEDRDREAESERQAERAWLVAAEDDPEAREEMEREDALGFS